MQKIICLPQKMDECFWKDFWLHSWFILNIYVASKPIAFPVHACSNAFTWRGAVTQKIPFYVIFPTEKEYRVDLFKNAWGQSFLENAC